MSAPTTELVSGEGVAFDLDHAGVGSRMVAAALDIMLQLVAILLLAFIDGAILGAADPAALTAIIIVELVLVVAGYPILCEWLGRGRTLGKMWLGLRVVRDDGGPIGFRQAMVRGIAGLVIEKPGILFPISTVAGIITMIFEPRTKRIGDLMAGTFVLNERAGGPQGNEVRIYPVPYELQQWAGLADLSHIDDRLALSVRQFVLRASRMSHGGQRALEDMLRAQVEAAVAPPPPAGCPTPWLLMAVLSERRRRAEIATQPAYQPGYAPQPSYQPLPYQPRNDPAWAPPPDAREPSDNPFTPPS